MKTARTPLEVAQCGAEAVAAALTPPGQIATLILPADVSWSEAGAAAARIVPPTRPSVSSQAIDAAARALQTGEKSVLLLNGQALREAGLIAGSRAAQKSGARLMCDTFTGRLERGAGLPAIERLPYFGEMCAAELDGVKHLVLVGSAPPVSFFAYPGKPNYLVPEGCTVHVLAHPHEDGIGALEALADALGAPRDGALLQAASRPAAPTGKIDAKTIAEALGAHLPENAIVVDEGNTEGFLTGFFTAGAPRHSWLSNTGGSIGIGTPLAVGAATACPDRKVVCLEGDGSAMYTIQSLWTMAREQLDVTTIILANHSYRILNIELMRVGAENAGARAQSQLDLSRPNLDFVALARGMGVPGVRCDTVEDFSRAFARAMAEPGPHLIEAMI
jgi:acetolactate synthase-1/2/3 large subunit